jgi:excisionase family DNA binding protein
MLTLGQAARHCGVSKGTISKAIASGKLSATRREDGSWAIDGAELARYLDVNGHRFRPETGSGEQPATMPNYARGPSWLNSVWAISRPCSRICGGSVTTHRGSATSGKR